MELLMCSESTINLKLQSAEFSSFIRFEEDQHEIFTIVNCPICGCKLKFWKLKNKN